MITQSNFLIKKRGWRQIGSTRLSASHIQLSLASLGMVALLAMNFSSISGTPVSGAVLEVMPQLDQILGQNVNKLENLSEKIDLGNKSLNTPTKSVADQASRPDYVQNEILVKFRDDRVNLRTATGKSKSDNFASAQRLTKREESKKNNLASFRIDDGKAINDKIKELGSDPDVEYAQPNFIYYPSSISTDDTYRANLWGLDNTGQTIEGQAGTVDADIDAPEAWAVSEGSSIIVAVLDTGVDYTHPDLVDNMWDGTTCVDYNNQPLGSCVHGYDFGDDDNDPYPTTSTHGTHVAGTIAAVKNNATGVVGVAPQAKIMAVKTDLFTTMQVVKGIQFAENNGANIINASFGSNSAGSCASKYDQAQYDAIANFDGIFVAAAGNAGQQHTDGSNKTPVDFGGDTSCWTGLNNIIGVAATDNQDAMAYFSDYGTGYVDVGAPGYDIYSSIEGAFASIPDTSVFAEDFMSVSDGNLPSGWTETGTAWGVYSNYLFVDNPGLSAYTNSQANYLTVPTLDLSAMDAASVVAGVYCNTEYASDWRDYLSIELSNDGGGSFTEFGRYSEYSMDNDTNSSNNEAIFIGYASDLFTSDYPTINIPAAYLNSNFQIRFKWTSNASAGEKFGCFLYDAYIFDYSSHTTTHGYEYMSGTSMATPHVVGLAALAWGYQPTASWSQIKTSILDNGDSIPALSGNVATGRRINAKGSLDYLTDIFVAKHFEVTGAGTQTAGTSQTITITVKNGIGSTDTSYTGSHSLTFSGLIAAPDGTQPTCTDSSSADVNLGTATALDFTAGVATCTLKVYAAESASIDATDGTYDTSGDSAYDLDLAISPAAVNAGNTSISVSPTSGTVGVQENISVTAKDIYENIRTTGGDTLVVSVTGANSVTPSVTDNADGTYSATYVPTAAGEDDISGTLNASAIGQDTDGTSDGTYHLSVIEAGAHLQIVTSGVGGIAGEVFRFEVSARNISGNLISSYSGDHAVTFSGASISPNGQVPTVTDRNGVDIDFGEPTLLNFVNGRAELIDVALYAAENISIDATDGAYSTSGDDSYDLDYEVTPAAGDPSQSIISASPDPGLIGGMEGIVVEIRDTFGNHDIWGEDEVSISVVGANTASPTVTGHTDGTYTASYTTANAGTDLITAMHYGQPIGQDNDGTSDGIYNLTVTEGVLHFEITSAEVGGTAGQDIDITVTARTSGGSVATTYDGEHELTFSGAVSSPNSYVPVATDNNSDYVDFGNGTALDFVDGVATTTVVLYAAEDASIESTDGTVSTEDNEDYDLDLAISPSITNPYETGLDVEPDPGVKDEPVTVTVTVRDAYGNQVLDGGDDVTMEVAGANSPALIVVDNEDGTYESEYVPANTGEDLITAMINGDDIIHDDDGDDDGIYHLTIQDVPGGGTGDFGELKVKFDKDDVDDGKTSKDKVEIKFSHTDNIAEYKVSSDKNFSNNDWKGMKSKIKVKIKTDDGKKQKFNFIFKDNEGNISDTYTLKVEYQQQRKIRDFKKTVKRWEVLHQTGKRFKKNSEVKIYFSRPDGTYYAPVIVKTDKKGTFALDYLVRKPSGTYTWYAVDSNGKKSNKARYKIID